MKIIVCGSRNFDDYALLCKKLDTIGEDLFEIIQGGCSTGADSLAKRYAKERHIPCTQVNADWKKYGKSAGPIRNSEMLTLNPDMCIGFLSATSENRGTMDMIRKAQKKKGVIVHVIKH